MRGKRKRSRKRFGNKGKKDGLPLESMRKPPGKGEGGEMASKK